jgi:hypothetical protein
MPKGFYPHNRRIGKPDRWGEPLEVGGPVSAEAEAKAMAWLVKRGIETPDEVRADIGPTQLTDFSPRGRRYLELHCTPNVIERALEHRRRTLEEFDKLLATAPKKCSPHIMETKAPPTPQPQDARSVVDICNGQVCHECGIARAVRAVGEKALCLRCYKVELGAESTG